MKLDVSKKGQVTILGLSGEVSLGKGDLTLRDKFRELLAAGDRRFVIDVTDVPYLDSRALGDLVGCHMRAKESGAEIKLAVPDSGRVRDLFVVARLDHLFGLYPDADAALASFDA